MGKDSQRNPYPNLGLLAAIWSVQDLNEQQRLETILSATAIHWGTPQHQEHLLAEMDNYSKERKTGLGTSHTTRWNEHRKRDRRRLPCFTAMSQASSVFHALDACIKACGCNGSAHDYRVRLALETHNHGEVSTSPKFTLHILTSSEGCAWKEACVETVSSK